MESEVEVSMKYIDEYRDDELAERYAAAIRKITVGRWKIMEICGGQTHSIVKYGLEELLPNNITLIHGPGCPVCVTPLEMIDKAIAIASMKDVIFTSFGDMLRVPGSNKDLLMVKAEGGDVRIVYSPIDVVSIAEKNPGKKVVFFAVGFETTAPASAAAVLHAEKNKITNFSILCSHVLVPPAIEALFQSDENSIDGLLAAGHVCTVMGYEEYIPISQKFKIPIVVTGFEPVDILQGIFMTVKQLEEKRYEVENQYSRSVRCNGNIAAKKILTEVFEISNRKWRGIGLIPLSGYKLRNKYQRFDAEQIFQVTDIYAEESDVCIAGKILQGIQKPHQCNAFGTDCTPEHPLGAPMVSSEGACAAYYHYNRLKKPIK